MKIVFVDIIHSKNTIYILNIYLCHQCYQIFLSVHELVPYLQDFIFVVTYEWAKYAIAFDYT